LVTTRFTSSSASTPRLSTRSRSWPSKQTRATGRCPSIIHAIIFELLDQAHRELYIPDAAHVGVGGFSYDAPEISLRAVQRMIRSALQLAGYDFGSQAAP
jgi:hypothetical protein